MKSIEINVERSIRNRTHLAVCDITEELGLFCLHNITFFTK